VLDGIERALDLAIRDTAPLVVASKADHFAFGAYLDDAMDAAATGATAPLERALRRYQSTMLRLRYSVVPTVAAVRGVAISGGCEVLMHCTHVVLHSRSVVGLAEASVGVVPGGGGLKELALRASSSGGDLAASIESAFDTVAAARLARGADQAIELGWLAPASTTVDDHPFTTACGIAASLGATHRPPPANPRMRVAGAAVASRLIEKQRLACDAGTIGAHQLIVDSAVARVLTGGASANGSCSETEMLALEREVFLPLATSAATQQRFAHLRATGEVLRN
jgi:3-hydroxyacyl-CoA dehydrogenase